MEPVISFRKLSHYYGRGALRKQVLFDISADVFPREIVILTGPSGSGKTTLLTLAGALRSLDEGSASVLGQELNGAGRKAQLRVREKIGFIFQQHNLLEALTACQNVQMALGVGTPVPQDEALRVSVEMLERVGLGHHVGYYPHQLSGGQKQRVAIARALVRRPPIILADEPTAALDSKSGREVVELLHHLAKSRGCTILLVTHDNRILDIADRILTLEDGHLNSFASRLAANTGHLLTAFAQLRHRGELERHVASLSSQQFLEVLEQSTIELEQFLRAVDLGNQEAAGALFDQVLEAVMRKIRDLMRADRCSIFLVDRERGMLESRIAQCDGGKSLHIEIPMTRGIAARVARTGAPLNVAEPYLHPDFNPDVDQETGYYTRNILCMPILDRGRKVFAVAELLNKNGGDPFGADDERAFREFAEPLGLILESRVRLEWRTAKTEAQTDLPSSAAS